jgi:rhomboid family GlyGly-CTERM serine protease
VNAFTKPSIKSLTPSVLAALALVIPMLLVRMFSADTELMYNRALVFGGGEYWRLLTANFAHFNAEHLRVNAIGVLLVTLWFYPTTKPRDWFLGWGITMLASTVFLLFDADLHWYVGMSGAVYGMVMFGAVQQAHQGHKRTGWVLITLVCAKLLYDRICGSASEQLLSMPVVDVAHVYGAIAGAVWAGILYKEFE